MDVPVEISRVVITELSDQQVVFLREIGGSKSFPIIIGLTEALALDRKIKGTPFPRPLTHDLLISAVKCLGGKIDRLIIANVVDQTFFASLVIKSSNKLCELDCRPSDGLALATAINAPIFVDEEVIEKVTSSKADTQKDRLKMLYQRRELLIKLIAEAQKILTNDDFLYTAPEEIVTRSREELYQLQLEFEAISEILDKYNSL